MKFSSYTHALIAGALGLTIAWSSSTAGATAPPVPGPHLSPSSCGVSVAKYLTSDRSDDSKAFLAAQDAALLLPRCYASGPRGKPQAVVYVPAGTYRLANVLSKSNVRWEVNAGATLEQPANHLTAGAHPRTPLFIWGEDKTPITNVSLVGVGSSLTPTKSSLIRGVPLADATQASTSPLLQLDPSVSGSTNENPALLLENVQYFTVSNLLIQQNATNEAKNRGNPAPWPTTDSAALVFFALKSSPLKGPFQQPSHGGVSNVASYRSPYGFGPDQVGGATDVAFSHIYSQGGTALRLETDAAMNGDGTMNRGETVTGVRAQNVVGVDCNRGLSLAPHEQKNGTVAVAKLVAYHCNEGFVANFDGSIPASRRGNFSSVSISGFTVTGGAGAQIQSTTALWRVGTSYLPFYAPSKVTWKVQVTDKNVSGTFTG